MKTQTAIITAKKYATCQAALFAIRQAVILDALGMSDHARNWAARSLYCSVGKKHHAYKRVSS